MEVGRAQGVRGVGGSFGDGLHEDAQGVRVALVGQYVAHRVPHARGDRVRASRGQRAASGPLAGVERVEDGVEQRPQGVGALGS